MNVCLTIDLEHDCPPFLTTYRGITEGAPRLLEVLAEEGAPATFFTTGDVARRHPEAVSKLVQAGHELGCHGDTHRRFSGLDETEAHGEIARASAELRRFAEVTSFRAPNLDLPPRYLPLLAAAGYRLDSSRGRHKRGTYFQGERHEHGVRCVPASISPLPLRAPGPIRDAVLSLLRGPVVLFFHPWEFVDMTRAPIRLDCRVRTGAPALHHLRQTIRYFRRRGATFYRMRDLP